MSIVDPGKQGPKGDNLLVRARIKGDIQRVFPGAKVEETPLRDYRFRAFIPRSSVADAIHQRVMGNFATNFKNSVSEDLRHDAYARIWGVMYGVQHQLNGKTIAQFEKSRPKGKPSPLFPDDEFERF